MRRLEPGIRECYAVVIMPSFVPYAKLNISSNWFNLVNPKKKELTTSYAMKLSNQVKAIENCVPCVADGQMYRNEELDRLAGKAKQLETRLPLQSSMVQIPYENTLGGFGMFNTGVTDLTPELIGWYGTPSINPNAATTVFLAGDHFSVHQTTVIAGGQAIQPSQVQLLSRQVAQVTIPQNPILVGDASEKFVDVQLATPYGVTQHMLIPAIVPPKPDATPAPSTQPTGTVTQSIAWKPATFSIAFTYSGSGISPSPGGSSTTPAAVGTMPPPPAPNYTPNSVVIQQGDMDPSKYDVVDVTLKFDPKYAINPTNSIVIPNVQFDSTQQGYAIQLDSFTSQMFGVFGRVFGPEDFNSPVPLSTTTLLTFRSSAKTYPDVSNKTTSNSLTIKWIKAATGGASTTPKSAGQ